MMNYSSKMEVKLFLRIIREYVISVLPKKYFWRKVLDIYATSIDYDPKSESSILFFQTIQK